jgi:PAS domain S-box-containing protein
MQKLEELRRRQRRVAAVSREALENALRQLDETRVLIDLVSARLCEPPEAGERRSPREIADALYCAASHLERINDILDSAKGVVSFAARSPQPVHGLNPELLEFTNDAVIIWEMDGAGIVYWNSAAEHLYGFSRDEACGQTSHFLLQTRLSGTISDLEATLARYGVWVGELQHTTRDGRRITVESRLAVISQNDGRWIVLEVNRDVTNSKRAEADRQVREERLVAARRQTAQE